MSEQINPNERGDGSIKGLIIAGAAAAVCVVAVFGSRELAEMPEDTYSSIEGVQVNVPSNIFEQAARKLWGRPEINTNQMSVTEAIALTADMRDYDLDSEAAVDYAIQEKPGLEPYRNADLPAGVTQIPLPNPDIQFIGALDYPFMMTAKPDITAVITNPSGSRNAPLQDAIYVANAPALFENNNVYPNFGSYPVGAYDLSKWVGQMTGMTDKQKNITADQAVALLTPPIE